MRLLTTLLIWFLWLIGGFAILVAVSWLGSGIGTAELLIILVGVIVGASLTVRRMDSHD